MKTLTVYCDKDLVFRWNEWPTEPMSATSFETKGGLKVELGGDFGYEKAITKYRAALELAKRESKPFAEEDQRYVEACCKMVMPDRGAVWEGCQPDTFYSFPFEGGVEVIEVPEYQIDHTSYPPMIKVARLVPSEPSESQDDLWNEAQDFIKNKLGTYSNDLVCDLARWSVEAIKDKYILTRKHP